MLVWVFFPFFCFTLLSSAVFSFCWIICKCDCEFSYFILFCFIEKSLSFSLVCWFPIARVKYFPSFFSSFFFSRKKCCTRQSLYLLCITNNFDTLFLYILIYVSFSFSRAVYFALSGLFCFLHYSWLLLLVFLFVCYCCSQCGAADATATATIDVVVAKWVYNFYFNCVFVRWPRCGT